MPLTQSLSSLRTVGFQKRKLWHWINMMFNVVDEDRRKKVGPDRSCAEWLLRNGGAVKWSSQREFLRNYNRLPDESVRFKITEIDATGSSIMHYGFPHLVNCDSIKKIILHKCNYLEDPALKDLSYVKNTLLHLQVSNCPNISETGLLYLQDLNKLRTLLMFDLQGVTKKDDVVKVLKGSLPKTTIEFK